MPARHQPLQAGQLIVAAFSRCCAVMARGPLRETEKTHNQPFAFAYQQQRLSVIFPSFLETHRRLLW